MLTAPVRHISDGGRLLGVKRHMMRIADNLVCAAVLTVAAAGCGDNTPPASLPAFPPRPIYSEFEIVGCYEILSLQLPPRPTGQIQPAYTPPRVLRFSADASPPRIGPEHIRTLDLCIKSTDRVIGSWELERNPSRLHAIWGYEFMIRAELTPAEPEGYWRGTAERFDEASPQGTVTMRRIPPAQCPWSGLTPVG
jgi:hypothetical protein